MASEKQATGVRRRTKKSAGNDVAKGLAQPDGRKCDAGKLGDQDDEAHKGHAHSIEPGEVQDVDNYYGGAEDADLISELSSCISWPFAVISGVLGLFVLYNLPAVSALFSGGHIQLKLGDTILIDFNA